MKVIVLVGPTASGKTDLSLKIAKYLNTDIISGDSVQVYRSLDIGSAKIKKEEMIGITHHLIDILDPSDNYSVEAFQRESRKLIEDLTKNNKVPFIVGGTGFYIKAALYDYQFNDSKRTDEFDDLSNEEIFSKLVELNDKEIPDVRNRKRLLRHLEIYSRGEEVKHNKDIPIYDSLIIGLKVDRDILYDRINKRVDKMVEEGLIEEAKKLYDQNIHSNAVLSIGYKELYDYFDSKITLDEAINLIKQHSRNFAKRQYTWFNNQMDVKWIDPLDPCAYKKTIELIDSFLKE